MNIFARIHTVTPIDDPDLRHACPKLTHLMQVEDLTADPDDDNHHDPDPDNADPDNPPLIPLLVHHDLARWALDLPRDRIVLLSTRAYPFKDLFSMHLFLGCIAVVDVLPTLAPTPHWVAPPLYLKPTREPNNKPNH